MTTPSILWQATANALLAQTQAHAPEAAAAQPVNPVGVPGASPTAPSTGSSPSLPPASSGSGMNPIMLVLPVLAFMLLMTYMAGRKDKKKQAQLMADLKKHDKVQMIGGIIGTVAELTDSEVVLRVEEGRVRFARSAVQTILNTSKAKTDAIAEVKGEAKAAV